MKYNFTVRIYQGEKTCLSDLNELIISEITIISKRSKFGGVCLHMGNQRKFKYSAYMSKKFSHVGGSINFPCLTFKGKYIDIQIKNFPRFPVFCQDKYAARSCLQGYGYTNYLNKGFPSVLLYRKIEIIIDKI